MNPLRHTMIMASAGSGKTYALTSRFVALLAAGAAPDRIVALTFTRKAAGEFFDEILHKLAHAAREPGYARALASDIGRPELGPPDFLRLLRTMVDTMHRLRLGTLDGFFARIARAFPLELGLAGEFEVLQEHAARMERRRVLRAMFSCPQGRLDTAQTEFIEAFKRATFGAEEKRLGARLDAFIDQHQENFLAAPDASTWGAPGKIWRDGTPWLAPEIVVADVIPELRGALGELTEGQRMRWDRFFGDLVEWTPGAPLTPAIEYILKNALAVWPELCDGSASMTVERRKLPLAREACAALQRIITHLVGAELRRRIETTQGIFAVLHGYEANYHATVRRVGKLTFGDVQRLLEPRQGAPRLESSASSLVDELPLFADAAERRLMLDYRLDAGIDHWLLDEFQDTSFGQWSVLRNLIDEVVQDAEGRRSFFCVGDIKQAIYAWREGDPKLLREIFDHYNAAAPGAIEEQYLTESRRSGPALIEMVNAIFGSAPTLAELFPGEASATWNREWRPHTSAVPERFGQAALLLANDEEGRWAATRTLLQEIQPLERGLSCAILVKKNATAAALADYLRHAGIAALAESDLHIAADNPLGAVLLALVQVAAHPGDTLAMEHVRMTPLAALLAKAGADSPETISRLLLGQIHANGFERALGLWVAQLESQLAPTDIFSRQRGREFLTAAGLFDENGSRDCDEFIAFMQRYALRPPESGGAVRLLTIHKSKGLGFDVVILPDLQGNRIDERRDGLAVRKAEDRSIEWILDLPPRLFCERDPVLAAYLMSAEADACYESLSLLYVALTRAKRAMYAIIESPGKSTSRNFPRLLTETLGSEVRDVRVGTAVFSGTWMSGDPDWHAAITMDRSPAGDLRSTLQPIGSLAVAGGRRIARRPSDVHLGRMAAAPLFSLENAIASEFGTVVHALLAEVEWAAAADADLWAKTWRGRGESELAVVTASACLGAEALSTVWHRRADRAEVWRERSFEVVLDDTWVTGIFDRVVIERDASGRAIRAEVFDFKTNRITDVTLLAEEARRYAEQVSVYRRVAAILTGLPATQVSGKIVFTNVRQGVEIVDN